MNLAALLKDSANTYMAARLARQVAGDVVRKAPYPVLGTAALLGVWAGARITRRRKAVRR
jgi:ElaB/YqjD/DUF883 family membrane-anchored ribosome-binding protein